MVAPLDTSARETDLVIHVSGTAYDHANLVPAERRRVLNENCLTDALLGKGSSVLVIVSLHLESSGGSTMVAILRFGLPFLGEGFRVGGNAGTQRVVEQILRREFFFESESVAQLQKTSVEFFRVNVAGGSCLQDDALH